MAELKIQLFSDPRFEDLTAEALVDGKFLLAMRPGGERDTYIVELRAEEFVSECCVEEVELEVLLDAIARTKRALAPGYQ